MVFLLSGVGIVVVIATAFLTANQYDALPGRVPIHFGFDGIANGFGPRAAAWTIPGVELAIALSFWLQYAMSTRLAVLALGDCIIAICFCAQVEILQAAISGSNRLQSRRFWPRFALLLTVGVALTALWR